MTLSREFSQARLSQGGLQACRMAVHRSILAFDVELYAALEELPDDERDLAQAVCLQIAVERLTKTLNTLSPRPAPREPAT